MPARKPQDLKVRHDTAEEKATRIGDEQAMSPKRDLPSNPPVQLNGHKAAGAVWRRMIRVYGEIEAKIVTAMDLDILVDLCICEEQLQEMDLMRASARKNWESLNALYNKMVEKKAEYDQVLRAGELINAAYDKITKLDARVDAKRKLLHTLRQSLYLTPRARSAAAPSKKTPEAPPDEFENLLDCAIDFTKTGGKGDAK
jgi:hypothetical protein